jgi:hypothetical protein
MTIGSLKDLEKLVKLCRKVGIDAIKIDGIELSLATMPYKASKDRSLRQYTAAEFSQPGISEARIDTPDELTDEQLLFYSAQSHAETV